MQIRDISDRVYQGQVYRLFDEARSSIVISMYVLKPGEQPSHPVNRLLEDLLEARGRGVEVTIYLNTKFEGLMKADQVTVGPWFDRLKKAGVVLRLVSPVRRMHDKLIVIDRRIVVEGSMNWSVSAITDNFESATIIESPELAASKLRRVGFFPLWGEEKKAPKKREELFPAGPPTSIEISAALIETKNYFPSMIASREARALKMFLLLLYLSEARKNSKFIFSQELVGEYLGILPGKDRSAVRRQVIKVLKGLEAEEKLLHVEFRHGKDTYVEIFPPAGGRFTLGSDDLAAGELAVLSDNEIFIRLVKVRLRAEGKNFEALSQAAIEKRFFIDKSTIRETIGPRRQGRKPAPQPL